MNLSEREKIGHLLRRFGLGATPEEVEVGVKMGVEGMISHLIEYDKVDEGFDVSPWEFCFEEGKDEVYLDPFRPAAWWALRLVMTKRPLQEKLALFWHDHFAVSAAKVEFGPMMLTYLNTLRKHGNGSFEALLQAVSHEPAMLFWLDGMQNQKGHPNENFAREVMELFTIGIGRYTEKDVLEASRAFTGWGIRFLIYEQGGERVQETAKDCMKTGRPMTTFAFSPELHDSGPKTILGQTKNWTGEELLTHLAGRPETAKLLAAKLWSFFAYPDPSPAVVDRIASVLKSTGMQIKPALYEIARSPEFWSEKCVRQQVKSPLDFNISILRQLGVGPFLAGVRQQGGKADPMKPLAPMLRGIAGVAIGLMNQQGMLLLYPPDVAGWEWGPAWITSGNMTQRIRLGDVLMGVGQDDKGGAAALSARVVAQGLPKTPEELVSKVLLVLDAAVSAAQEKLMVEACEKAGGPSHLGKPETASPVLASICRLLFASPEFQLC